MHATLDRLTQLAYAGIAMHPTKERTLRLVLTFIDDARMLATTQRPMAAVRSLQCAYDIVRMIKGN